MQCDTPHCSWTVTSAVQATLGQHALVSSCKITVPCHNKSLLGGRNADLGCHEVQGTSKTRGPHQLQESLQRLDIDVDEHQGCTKACCSRKRNAILQWPAATTLGAMPAGADKSVLLQTQGAVGGELYLRPAVCGSVAIMVSRRIAASHSACQHGLKCWQSRIMAFLIRMRVSESPRATVLRPRR